MARESPVFQWVAKALERATELNQIEARGTVRIALRKGGLDPRSIGAHGMRLVLERTMPHELAIRGYEHAPKICESLVLGLLEEDFQEVPDPDQALGDILRRVLGE